MTFARWVFGLGGAVGLVILLPMYFLENTLNDRLPPPMNHPEHFYAFVGVAAAFQFVYLTIASDPVRYRAIMPWGAVGKLSFVGSTTVLWLQGRAEFSQVAATGLDAVLAVLFLIAYARTPRRP
jgi:hypothetical protein